MEPSQVDTFFSSKFEDKFGFNLKKEQSELISKILNGKNTLGIFPTGFGKSLCFYVLPKLFDEIREEGNICLVLSPLRSLMIDQVVAANKYGIPAAAVMKDEMDDNTIRGSYEFNCYILNYHLIFTGDRMKFEKKIRSEDLNIVGKKAGLKT